jgi:hypothetical protein
LWVERTPGSLVSSLLQVSTKGTYNEFVMGL